MRISLFVLLLLLTPVAAGPLDPPPSERGSGMRSALDRTSPAQPGAWERIQGPINRSTGRIEDQQSYELYRLNRLRDERLGRIEPQREFDHLQEERERQLRLDERGQRLLDDAQRRRAELDLREYELFLRAGLSSMSLQAQADEQELRRAKSDRDEQLIAAETARIEARRLRPGDREQIEQVHAQRVREIREEYERQRQRILGWDSLATTPTTAPTTQQQ
jgi:hypothetical protein